MSRTRSQDPRLLDEYQQPPRYRAGACKRERTLELTVRERVARKTEGRRKKDPALAHIAADYTHPTRTMARLIRRAKANRWTLEELKEALIEPLVSYAESEYGHKPAA